MKNRYIILLIAICLGQLALGQNKNDYSDQLLTSSFKLFQSADLELANHMLPFIRERFENELKDTSSFENSYDSLSNYIGIKYASDGLLKTYCWSERSGGCCHTSATFAQFKTKSGKIKYRDLESPKDDGTEIFITDLQKIEFNDNSYYLILGWGTCCEGKHYEIARIYQIREDNFVQVDAVFEGQKDLFIGANRDNEIELKYNPELKELTYNHYEFDDETGFYTREKSMIKWTLKKDGFKK